MCTPKEILAVDTKLSQDHHFVTMLANVCCGKFNIPSDIDLDTLSSILEEEKQIEFMECLHDAKVHLLRITKGA